MRDSTTASARAIGFVVSGVVGLANGSNFLIPTQPALIPLTASGFANAAEGPRVDAAAAGPEETEPDFSLPNSIAREPIGAFRMTTVPPRTPELDAAFAGAYLREDAPAE